MKSDRERLDEELMAAQRRVIDQINARCKLQDEKDIERMERQKYNQVDWADPTFGGTKFDAGKVRMDLFPKDAQMAIAQVLTYGAMKYDAWNWAKGLSASRLVAAMERHMAAWQMGEECDDESDLPHLWHAGCCMIFLISSQMRNVLDDDRERSALALDSVRYAASRMNDPREPVKEQMAKRAMRADRDAAFAMGLEEPYTGEELNRTAYAQGERGRSEKSEE